MTSRASYRSNISISDQHFPLAGQHLIYRSIFYLFFLDRKLWKKLDFLEIQRRQFINITFRNKVWKLLQIWVNWVYRCTKNGLYHKTIECQSRVLCAEFKDCVGGMRTWTSILLEHVAVDFELDERLWTKSRSFVHILNSNSLSGLNFVWARLVEAEN